MCAAGRIPADLDRVVAEGDGLWHHDLPAHGTARAGLERIAVGLAVQLDLAHLVGRHVGSRHEDTTSGDHGGWADGQSRRLGRNGGANTEHQEQDKHQDGGGRDHERAAAWLCRLGMG